MENNKDFLYRKVNVSAWTSEEAAKHWYENSEAHKEIFKQYHEGGLEQYSAMLASLGPHKQGSFRWEARCR